MCMIGFEKGQYFGEGTLLPNQGEYRGGQSPYFIPTKDDICFI